MEQTVLILVLLGVLGYIGYRAYRFFLKHEIHCCMYSDYYQIQGQEKSKADKK